MLYKVAMEPDPLPGCHWIQTFAEFIESYKNIAEVTQWPENTADFARCYENLALFTEGRESIECRTPLNPPVCLSTVSSESMPANKEET